MWGLWILIALPIVAGVVIGALVRWPAKRFLIVAAAAAALFPVCVLLHNALSAAFHTEEPVFFILSVTVAPVAFLAGLSGAITSAVARRSGSPPAR